MSFLYPPKVIVQVAGGAHLWGGWWKGYSEQSAPSIPKDKKFTAS